MARASGDGSSVVSLSQARAASGSTPCASLIASSATCQPSHMKGPTIATSAPSVKRIAMRPGFPVLRDALT
jgi:hypothetical protein